MCVSVCLYVSVFVCASSLITRANSIISILSLSCGILCLCMFACIPQWRDPIRIGFQIVFNIALTLIRCANAVFWFSVLFDLSKHLIQASIFLFWFPLAVMIESFVRSFVQFFFLPLSMYVSHHSVLKCHYFNSIWMQVYYIRFIYLCISMLAGGFISTLPNQKKKKTRNLSLNIENIYLVPIPWNLCVLLICFFFTQYHRALFTCGHHKRARFNIYSQFFTHSTCERKISSNLSS